MLKKLKLTKNVKIYRGKRNVSVNLKSVIERAVSNKKPGTDFIVNKFKENAGGSNGNEEVYIYANAYISLKSVYFLEGDEYKDEVYSFIFMVEHNSYLFVFSHGCMNFTNEIEKNYELIGSDELSKALVGEHFDFKKMSTKNMTASSHALRSRSLEAYNLKGVMASNLTGKSIPYYIKGEDNNSSFSISSTGRLNEDSTRVNYSSIVDWTLGIKNRIESPGHNDFLESFASKANFSEVMSRISPSAILIDINSILEYIENSKTPLYCLYKDKYKPLPQKVFDKLIKNMGEVYCIDENEINQKQSNNKIKLNSKLDSAAIKINQKSVTFSSRNMSRIWLKKNGEFVKLTQYIIKNKLYSVVFDDPRYMYFLGSIFEDKSSVSEILPFWECSIPFVS